jgi:DNA-3-methyladenine glycosylase
MQLSRSFYTRPTLEVCPDILGKHLVFHSPLGKLVGEINEVEAYIGKDDPACHAFRGKTTRTAIMFEEGGYSYIYFIYGMYFCLNVTTEAKDCAAAILIRSVIPVEGAEIMKKNRGVKKEKLTEKELQNLTNGPGKLCQAFGLTRDHNAIDLVSSDLLYLEETGKRITEFKTSPRVGITQATDRLWRFQY